MCASVLDSGGKLKNTYDFPQIKVNVSYMDSDSLILEKLYNHNHIVIGYELVKLSSIQLSLGDCAAVDSINRPCDIFSCYYGSYIQDFTVLSFNSLRG
ncbi:hypothetical protein PRUPE_1G112300 [Prunus persica]|uniref:Uncharacterized protein n=1 Tax=Prunus persica TaxID=3760 RepID=A0A251QVS6_PRUPE|nr:hypothetical protein PRUPE_1G112300 [Prunus persica]